MNHEFSTKLILLGETVRLRRKALKKTLQQLAEESALSPRFLGDVERGRANVSVKGLCQIADALSVDAATLLSSPESRGQRLEATRLLNAWDEADLPLAIEFLQQRLRGRPSRRGLALIGLRGSGKTTIGREVAERLQVKFVELDQQLEELAGISLDEIFRIHGEDYYRQLEREALEDLVQEQEPVVVATGGSLVTDMQTFSMLRKHFETCWLKARPEDHWNRVLEQGDHRPIHGHPSAMTRLQEILVQRSPLYALAHHVVDTTALGFDRSRDAVEILVQRVLERKAESAE